MKKSESKLAKTVVDVGSPKARQRAPLLTPTDLKPAATRDIAAAMNGVLADGFALYLKTKNFHWHLSGPHFCCYRVMVDEQADQLYAMTDPIADRRSPNAFASSAAPRCVRSATSRAPSVSSTTMPTVSSRWTGWPSWAKTTRRSPPGCLKCTTCATSIATSPTASFIEVWIDETERRTWFLFETGRPGDATGH